ncbi:MAG: aminotransferase class V-fold PLP-dependent enzyme [Campylobacteraceae bacterium]|nr:aminotransferase class V-fold PLP-dependent enzyme [Campylobacteraceae bacterium]
MNKIYKNFLNDNTDTLNFLRYNTIGKHKKLYFDYTASGLGFRQIETRMYDVLETYANTHSKEASMASKTNDIYDEALNSLHRSLEVTKNFSIIPSGCGATGAIKKFQELIGLYIPPATKKRFNISVDKSLLPLVIVGPYEHHSNEVSFREALCEVIRIPLNDEGLVDLLYLEEVLKENKGREMIGSFCIASNVTGIITPYKKIAILLRRYHALIAFDAAASSSYMNVDCEYYDVMYLSPHKLLGGPGSCGLLVIRNEFIDTSIAPTFAGGGTVLYVNKKNQIFDNNLVARETAGTPGILQLIKASFAYQLRNEIGFNFIEKRKLELYTYFLNELKQIPDSKIYGNHDSKNIGIVSFNIGTLDPYKICDLISKDSGVQTRAGCSCAGPYGHDLLGLKDQIDLGEKPGWLRISIHFTQTKEEIDVLINSIKESIKTLDK